MKKTRFIFSVSLVVLLLSGCKDYLDLPPKSTRAIVTLTDVKSTMGGYLYAFANRAQGLSTLAGPQWTFMPDQINMFEAYSDNIDYSVALTESYLKTPNLKTESFYADKLLWNDYTNPTNIWNTYYGAIGFMNTLIQQVDDITGGDESLRNQMKGEMLTHRAYFFLKLLEYFAPYDKADLGIPVYLNTGKETYGVANPRRPQNEVYATIISDLEAALTLISKTPPKTGFNIWYNVRYINNILAQVYWYKAESAAKEATDYQNAKKYALEAVKDVDASIPTTMTTLGNAMQGTQADYPAYGNNSNSQDAVGGIFGSNFGYLGYYPRSVKVASELFSLYSTTDIRYSAYFTSAGVINDNFWPDGKANGLRRGQFLMFQPEEAFLILAEAHYRLNEINESVAVLNKFKAFRNAGTATGLTGAALLQEIKNERRKEFFGHRDMRWLDLKRYGGVTLTRSCLFFKKTYTLTVPPNDFRYTLPIPLTELSNNPLLTANPGWVPIVY